MALGVAGCESEDEMDETIVARKWRLGGPTIAEADSQTE
jgi:hypothetical protein